jgi:hypothetical protein
MEDKPKRKAWRIWRRIISICATFVLFLLVSPFVLLAVVFSQEDGSIISVPTLNKFIEAKVAKNSAEFDIKMSAGGLTKGNSFFNPKVVFKDVKVRQKTGAPIVSLPFVYADSNIVTGIASDQNSGSLRLDSAKLFLWRDAQGRFNIANQDDTAETMFSGSFDQVIDGFFDLPIAKNIQKFEMNNVALSYVDGKTKNRFHLNQGNVQISVVENELMISSSFELPREGKDPSLVRFSGRRTRGNAASDITFKIDHANPVTLANQVPALDWLRNLEAEVSASFVVELDENARPNHLNGVLDLGAGRLRETPSNSAAAFNQAKAYFDYSAAEDIFQFSNFNISTTLGNISGNGSSQLERDLSGLVIGAKMTLTIDQLLLSQPTVFEDELSFENGRATAEVTFDPLHVKIDKAILNHGDLSIVTSGDLWAREDFWQSKFDLRLDQVNAQQVKLFWPTTYIPKTRKWITTNVQKGRVSDFTGFLSRQNGETEFDFKFAFDDVTTGLVATMAPLHDGQGEGSINQQQLTLNLARGFLTPDGGTPLDMSGSLFHIPEINVRPAIGQITLAAKGDIQSALKVLDVPKFRFIEKFGQTTDVAQGQASVLGWLEVPLAKGVKQNQIKFDFSGSIVNVSSDTLVKGRKLRAKQISIQARDSGIEMSGNATIDEIPAQFKWSQGFVDNPTKEGRLNSSLTLNAAALSTFNVSLPKGSFSGATPAQFDVKLLPNEPASFELTSGLKGAVLRIDSLGWRKGKNAKGKLSIAGRLSNPMEVDNISIVSNGLTAKGKIEFTKNGGFQNATFPTVKIGKWLSTSVTLIGEGVNATTQLKGGAMDLRRLNIGGTGGEKAGPLDINLDRLRLTDSLSLTGFSASIKRNGAPSGTFRARVNKGARIAGKITRGKKGSRITITGQDAGAILRSAGFFDNIHGGDLLLTLEPTGEADVYTGYFEADNFRMKHSNSMAKLLDGISVIGLLQKLEGGGIQFSKAKGRFELRPEGVQLIEVSLVGVSMGISLKGWYASKTKTVDFDGVVTPLYAVNGALERIAGKLFGRQKGEGVFSFVYTMKGPAAGPKVKVKPLSILTPGVFRQIFRQDIPAPPK